jgi:hypothetical protein
MGLFFKLYYYHNSATCRGRVAGAEALRSPGVPRGISYPCCGDRAAWPASAHWLKYVNAAPTEAELAALRCSVARGLPYDSAAWTQRTARRLGVEYTLWPRGRPKKASAGNGSTKCGWIAANGRRINPGR